MQRKIPTYVKGDFMGKLPFQDKKGSKVSTDLMLIHTLEAAKSAFPLFGGTEEEAKDESPSVESDSGTSPAASDTGAAGGDSPKAEPDIDGMTPEQVADLLKTVNELTTKVSTLTQENNTYKSKEQQASRAQQTKEQQLEQDLVDAQKVIAKMDAVIRHTAVVNAIQGAKDIEFHSAKHVLNELVADSFDLDVDLDSGTATVTGIDSELKRIAKEMPWLVSKDKTQRPDNTPTPRARASGAPPSNGQNSEKVAKRGDLINKFPVIAHGRSG